ncbi:glycosyltransferase [Photobacterium sp. SDRW27]|uniref:glycosyltransferase n=1 Tax=Photobacterium obscurum TaxID=2829490 RepID=UPI0022446FFD|nr:glycosyltransferase [Photobacterium obscurum]MCW8329587.1 glycosyltransferase [Photobacterium obscurum]
MERVAVNLADAFSAQGHNVDLIYLKNNKVELTPDNKNIPIHQFYLDKLMMMTGIGLLWEVFARLMNVILPKSLFVWKGLIQSQIFKYKLGQLEKNGQPFDMIIMRGQGTFELLWQNKDPRYIQVCENIFSSTSPNTLQSWYAKLLFQNKNIACVSEPVLENFKQYQAAAGFTVNKLATITNPLDSKQIGDKALQPLESLPTQPYILGLGRFVPQKDFPLLVKAYDILRKDYGIEHQLVLVGDGKESDTIKQLVESLGLTKHVVMPGATLTPYIWMHHSDLFVLSSKFEGLGMVIIEAFAAGTNVVATRCPGGVQSVMGSPALTEQLADMSPEGLAKVIHATLQKERPQTEIEQLLQRHAPEKIAASFIDLNAE